jgi:hypothetical protein
MGMKTIEEDAMNTLTTANAKCCTPVSGIREPRTAPRGQAARGKGRAAKTVDAEELQVQEILATFSARWEW